MDLHDEPGRPALGGPGARGLARPVEVPFAAVRRQSVPAAHVTCPPFMPMAASLTVASGARRRMCARADARAPLVTAPAG
ncbi:hypothetical protein Scani_25630 [Streptomyces caniferus]|uniref:Uncharacterized protein n=1 Tax=Streptomyces caniferus TaxID=285557 RepID=A0A640S9P7_9ACTN|nr:hypothetical protein Scani_25630 [Streptomyces caniferus]